MFFEGKYYTPKYGDLVETYDKSGMKYYIIEYDDMPLGIPDITSQLWTSYLCYKRSFTKDKVEIVMLPFNFTKNDFRQAGSDDPLTGKFYSFAGVNGSSPIIESTNEVTSMTANTPYLYVPDEDTEYWYIDNDGSGITIFTEGFGGGTKESVSGDWKLVGSYEGKVWQANEIDKKYNLENGELRALEAGSITRSTEGYFQVLFVSNVIAHPAALNGVMKYWTTFYDADNNYKLPAGAMALTMNSSKQLYVVGDGNIIPKNTAVIIMADASAVDASGKIVLTTTTETATPVSGNVLHGTSTATAAGANTYVLSKDANGNFGFFKFTGTIPANKAYINEE